ncbi:unnamed protein product [Ostreobium quekettii]|uniref:Uncharacterized protein n=1 Tax=Ostreobium quekettii TaxID=121088 RepID=A0A8S1IUP2_9CHLO|nr:unnamed protein product [Ostreobium quekettii]|eukprot:evm.model.scf_2494.2 EVM.evm.TU.scf_2494.2   scf_2494:10161-11541(+)
MRRVSNRPQMCPAPGPQWRQMRTPSLQRPPCHPPHPSPLCLISSPPALLRAQRAPERHIGRCASATTGGIGDGGAETVSDGSGRPPSRWARFKKAVFGDAALDRQRLKDLGLGALLSYFFVSNTTNGTFVVIAWITHVKRTGLTPLAKGQWPAFLAVYAGLFALQNIMRPIRLGVALALTPFVDRLMRFIQTKLSMAKPKVFGLLLFCVAVYTFSYVGFMAWVFGGFPGAPSPVRIR